MKERGKERTVNGLSLLEHPVKPTASKAFAVQHTSERIGLVDDAVAAKLTAFDQCCSGRRRSAAFQSQRDRDGSVPDAGLRHRFRSHAQKMMVSSNLISVDLMLDNDRTTEGSWRSDMAKQRSCESWF